MLDGKGGVTVDPVLDSSLHGLWRFGMYSPREPRIVATMEAIRDELSVKSAAGGQARYANDYYFQVDSDVSRVPGNPWFICTLWLAQWYIAIATAVGDLERARKIIDWVCAHELPGAFSPSRSTPTPARPSPSRR